MDAVLLLRLAYLSAASLVLVVFAIPALRTRFLEYGPRAATTTNSDRKEEAKKKTESNNLVSILCDNVATLRVPHSWFTSFYAVSVACSLFWASELLLKGPIFRAVAQCVPDRTASMTFRQVVVVWIMMFAQGSRRLYECLTIFSPSKSQMWIGHWALGIFFYLGVNVSIWIEAVPKLRSHSLSTKDTAISPPNIRTFIGILVFIIASGFQHDCHAYLASLKQPNKTPCQEKKIEYRLPEHPAFNISITPHYFAECLIYLSLSLVAAPQGSWLNDTVFSALIFVMVNLGVTAHGTKKWYEQKFGLEAVKDKARMIPLFF